jgi:hypothetical protein
MIRTLLILMLACGARGATYKPASASDTDIQAAINQASGPADIVLIPPFTNSFGSLIITNGCSIIAARGTVLITNVNPISGGQQFPIFYYQAKSDRPCVIQGFTVSTDGVNDNTGFLSGYGGNTLHATKLRITDCTLFGFHFGMMIKSTFGVVDHCDFKQVYIGGRTPGYLNSSLLYQIPAPPWPWNSTNAWVYENNTFTLTNWNLDTVFQDSEYPSAYQMRYNTFYITNASSVGVDGFDMHGMDNVSEIYPISPQIYSNRFYYGGNIGVNPSRLMDLRGGANALIYSNMFFGGMNMYQTFRNNLAAGPLMTNSWSWENYGNSGAPGISTADGVTVNVNFFLSKPSNFAQLVYPHPYATPYITTHPSNQTVSAPGAASFSVVTSAGATYQWYKNEVAIAGAVNPIYITPATSAPDSGSYYFCVVTDANGSVHSHDAFLTVNGSSGTVATVTNLKVKNTHVKP